MMKLRIHIALLTIMCLWTVGMSAQDSKYHLPRYYSNRAENYIKSDAWNSAKREIDAGLEEFSDDPELRYLN